YQTAPTRAKLRTEFIQRNNGMVPHDWQIDIAEALLLGPNCSLIAGTAVGGGLCPLLCCYLWNLRR
ncbi:hypothetical protein DFH08DRAFT_704472, partial [Mycena albidolilacea]